jgi:GT2 family glycosyltransferase
MIHSDVTISILTYTAVAHARRTLSVILPGLDGAKLILTANGNPSAADLFYDIQTGYPNCLVVNNPVNQGFLRPNNVAFSFCTTPYFVTLNDDCIPAPGWLDKMKAELTAGVAIVGAKDTCQHIDDDFIGRRGGALEYIEASCMMVRCDLMTRPLFSTYLTHSYCEDADLSLRVRERGYAIAQADFVCNHPHGATSRTVPGIRHILLNNTAVCQKRWANYMKTRTFE